MAFDMEIYFPFHECVIFYIFFQNQNLQSHVTKLEPRLEIKTVQIVLIKKNELVALKVWLLYKYMK